MATMQALADAQRTYVRVATGDPDGVGVSRAESYRALHAVYHPPSFPHLHFGGGAAGAGGSAARAGSSLEVDMDSAEGSTATKRPAAAADGEEAPAAKKAKPAQEDVEMEMEAEEAEEDSDDWKATMYYWRGELSFDGGKKMLTWKGAWVGSTRGLPSDQEFAASPNAFTLTSAKIKGGVSLSATAAELEPAAGLKSKFTGSYQLDQGDGLETFSDKTHMFKISTAPDGSVLVAARGTTEFGAFVSAGRLESGGSTGVQLTLARRYVDDADPRKKWTTADRVTTELLSDRQGAFADGGPWRAAAMKLKLS
jgi:hypothetical protein